MGCFCHFCAFQEVRPSLTEEDIKRGSKKRDLDALKRDHVQGKGFTVIENWEYEWWRFYNTTNNVKQEIRENLPYRHSLTEHQLLEKLKRGNFNGYVQFDLEVRKKFRTKLAKFPPIFLVSKNDIGY